MTKKSLQTIAIFLMIFCIALLAACSNQQTSDSSSSEESLQLGNTNRYAGVVVAGGEIQIEKDAEKTIAQVNVSVGDEVKTGQVLFSYDGTQAQEKYQQATIELEQLRLDLQSQNDQRAALEQAMAVAEDETEKAEYALQIQVTDASIRETSYYISQKEKEVDKLRTSLEQLEVKSSVNGRVQSINAAGSSDQNGNPLPYMVIAKNGNLRVKAYINELNISELSVDDTMLIRSRMDEQTWKGHVSSIDYKAPADASQNNYYSDSEQSDTTTSSKYPFYVELDSSEGLILGQHVFVERVFE